MFIGICRDCANLHCAFGPYIMALAENAAKTGEPILRSMDDEFPGRVSAPAVFRLNT